MKNKIATWLFGTHWKIDTDKTINDCSFKISEHKTTFHYQPGLFWLSFCIFGWNFGQTHKRITILNIDFTADIYNRKKTKKEMEGK